MPQIDEYKKNIGFQGGFSFLVSSITGPGIPLIPSLYQTAGWLLPTVLFLVIGGMSALACLFLIESMTYFPGNKYFERNVEFTVLVHHFYGKRWYYFMHVILYGSLQSFNIASIIQAVQNFDTFVLSIAGQTCGFRYSPTQDIFCVNQVTASNSSGSPFGTNGMLITAGGLIFGGIIGPLMQLNLDDNMIIQWVSIMYVILVVIFWAIMCFVKGVQAGLMPSVGSGIRTAPTSVIAQVMFNFTLANTVPSWINTRNKKVNIHKCVFFSCYVACGVYVFTGIFGGLAFPVPSGANLLSVQSAYFSANGPNVMYGLANFISLTFPILILITSIPVAFIIVKLNLITSHICSKDWATFYGQILPFIVCVPFQTGPYMVYFTNWSSIIFQSMCNFMAPYLIFIFLDQRNTVMAQSVIDELENLDLDGAIKKKSSEDDDFDYVYHLPHADLSRLPPRKYDPFAQFAIEEPINNTKQLNMTTKKNLPAIATGSTSLSSLQGKQAAKLLNLGADVQPDPRSKRLHNHHHGSKGNLTAGPGSHSGSQRSLAAAGSVINFGLGVPGGLGSRRPSNFGAGFQNSSMALSAGANSNKRRSSMLSNNTTDTFRRRSVQSGKVAPEPNMSQSMKTVDFAHPDFSQNTLLVDGMSYLGSSTGEEDHYVDEMDIGPPSFKALPEFITKRVRAKHVALFCFVTLFTLTIAVLIYDFVYLGFGIDVVDGITFKSSR